MNQKKEDNLQIDKLCDVLFQEHSDGMYFDEFVEFTEVISSEFMFAIFDCLYQCVPCVKNFFTLRSNYLNLLRERKEVKDDNGVRIRFQEPTAI